MRRTPLAFVLAALLVFAAHASAATITPTRLDDPTSGGTACGPPATDCSLRNAIPAAGSGGTVQLRTPPSGKDVYTLTSGNPLVVNLPVTIVGVGPRTTVVQEKAANQPTFWLQGGQTTLEGITITGASGVSGWGVLDSGTSPVTLVDVSISGNASEGLFAPPAIPSTGGGVNKPGSGQLTLAHSSITGNTASAGSGTNGDGAGLYSSAGTVDVLDSTIAGNTAFGGSAPGNGGGIKVTGGTLNLSSTTVAGNKATGAGATGGNLQASGGATVNLTNTIVARGSADTAGTGNCSTGGAIVHSLGFNLEDTNQCSLTAISDRRNPNPLLGPLKDNGGFGIFTEALLPGSPAIDRGNPTHCNDALGAPVTTDQRGIHRALDGNGDFQAVCDIGAYEAPVLKPKCALKAGGSRVYARTTKKHKKGVLSLTARCNEAAGASLAGRIKATLKAAKGKKPKVKVFNIPTVHAALKPNTPRTLRAKLPKAALKALKDGAKESASFTLTAKNADGVATATAKIARLRLAKV